MTAACADPFDETRPWAVVSRDAGAAQALRAHRDGAPAGDDGGLAADPPAARSWTGAVALAELPDAAIDVLCSHVATAPSPLTRVGVSRGGGCDARWTVALRAAWTDAGDDDRQIFWSRAALRALAPWGCEH